MDNLKKILTKKNICRILDIPFDGADVQYTMLKYAEKATPGCIAYIQRYKFSPWSNPPRNVVESLAETAILRGAKALLYSSQIKDYPCIVTPGDSRLAVIAIMSEVSAQFHPLTIEITGSYAKTTTTSMIESVFSQKYKTYGLKGVNDNEFQPTVGRIQKLDSETEVFVQEAAEGASFGVPGMISEMIHPDICVVTSVGTSHLERLKTRERIMESCMSLQQGMKENGVVVLNGDDPYLSRVKPERRAVYYGVDNENVEYRAVNIIDTEEGLRFDIAHDGVLTAVSLHCYGHFNAQNAAAAFAVAKLAGLSDEEAAFGLSCFYPKGTRQNLVRWGNYKFYLDCYNASVESMKSSIDTLSNMVIQDGGRRIAVLADIREAGEITEEVHRAVGRYVRESKIDYLIVYGDAVRFILEEVGWIKGLTTHYAHSLEEVAKLLQELVTPLDIVLLKGSNAMGLSAIPDQMVGTWLREDKKPVTTWKGRLLKYKFIEDHAVVSQCLTEGHYVSIPRSIQKKHVTGVGENAFTDAAVQIVVVPETVRNIRKRAFFRAEALRGILLPESLRFIDDEAFASCKSLKEVMINEGCIHIGNAAFADCSSLRRVYIPKSVKQISETAFQGCENLRIICAQDSYAQKYAEQLGIKTE